MLAPIVQPFSRCVLNHGKGPNPFFLWGENTTFVYDEHGLLKCGSCGSRTFDMVAELRISDVSKDGEDPTANRTIESERVVSLVCARCGARVQ